MSGPAMQGKESTGFQRFHFPGTGQVVTEYSIRAVRQTTIRLAPSATQTLPVTPGGRIGGSA